VRIFDYAKFAEPFRERLRENAERLAASAGIDVEFIRKRNVRKEDLVKVALGKRGEHPGLVCILSAMEPCSSYKPWHDKRTGKTFLRPDDGKCLHYYFYFIDEELGLCYVRVPTWLPCRLQIYFNGHNWLAARLRRLDIAYKLVDNAFVDIGDWRRAQRLADGLEIKRLHSKLDQFARTYCPIQRDFGVQYHWSVDQCEYATDVVFKRQADLAAIYGTLTRTAIHTVKPDHIATFLGKKLSSQFEGESGNRYDVRIEGTRIRHTMGPVSLKLYDKFSLILRIETTVNDLTFFKHYREVEHRDGTKETKWASMQKTIYSLPALRELLEAANRRYMEFLSALDDPRNGRDKLDKLSQPVTHAGRSYPGSTSSIPMMTLCFRPSCAASSTSAACRISHCAVSCLNSIADRSRGSLNASGCTASSRRSRAATNTTSPPLAKTFSRRDSNCANSSSSRNWRTAVLPNLLFLPNPHRI
jgi:hypothetical protein